MGILDIFGGTNKFKKGMEAGAKPFEAKFLQYKEALQRLEKNCDVQWNKTKEVADKILDSVEATERARLYGLYAQTDIKELKSEYKEILIAILYTLSEKSRNEFQQIYIRSVQKYLDIKNPQLSIDLAAIDNIDSQNAQKAIFQSCIEYLLLRNEGPAFFEEYGEKLFSHFVIKDNVIEDIWGSVLQLYSTVGPFGLAEKYGFDPKVIRKQYMLSGETSDDEKGILEKQTIETVFLVKSEEEIIIEGKEIILNDDIYCEGKLALKDCILVYNGDNIQGRILLLDDHSSLLLSNCTIVGKNNTKRNGQSDRYLIVCEEGPKANDMRGASSRQGTNPKVIIERCNFINCYNFIKGVGASLKNSIVRYTTLPVFSEKKYDSNVKQGFHFLNTSFHDTCLEGCIIKGDKSELASYDGEFILGDVRSMKNCTVSNISNLCECFRSDNPTIQSSMFSNCSNIFGHVDNIADCVFENCTNIVNEGAGYSVQNTQFINCGKLIISNPKSISHCSFLNIQNPNSEDFDPKLHTFGVEIERNKKSKMINGWGISLYDSEKGRGNTISHCLFDGINHEGFIRFKYDRGIQIFNKKLIAYTISDCEFKHCVSGILDKKNYAEEWDEVGISIINCTGLDETRGGQAENPVLNQKTESGEPIGAAIEESEVGVPLYQSA